MLDSATRDDPVPSVARIACKSYFCASPNAAEPQPKRLRKIWRSSHKMVGWYFHQPGENAMTTVWRFLVKFAGLIVCTLHCFDRVLFKGHLALSAPTNSNASS